MNLFEAVKDAIPTRTAAEHYGIEVKRNGMRRKPYQQGHGDRCFCPLRWFPPPGWTEE